MTYWTILCIGIFFALLLYGYPNLKEDSKNNIVFLIASIFTYFSAFRMELGQDYENYEKVIFDNTREYGLVEPIYTLLIKSIYYFNSTEVLFFLVYALITNFCIIFTYKRFKNFAIMVVVYLSFSVLYFNTFNLVRQFCAASIILYGFRYIQDRNIIRYCLIVLIATLFHLSALFCLVFYFLWNKKVSNLLMVVLALFTYFYGLFGGGELATLFKEFFSYFNIYGVYLEGNPSGEGFGLLTVYFNLILILIVILNNKSINTDTDRFIMFMYLILVIIYNLIPSFFYFHRLSIYFLVFFPLIASVPVNQSAFFKFILIVSSGVLFMYFIFSNANNPKVIPSGMKSFLDLIG